VEAGITREHWYSNSEAKSGATALVAQLQKQIDGLAKSFRELDTKLQELNWKTDLV